METLNKRLLHTDVYEEMLAASIPKYDFSMEDEDGEAECVLDVSCLTSGAVRQGFVALSDLPVGSVPETDEDWQKKFNPESVYPPIVVEFDPIADQFAITQGNHRVILFRKWGFTHAPALIWQSQGATLKHKQVLD
jgi:hypothetical protein